MIKLSAIKICTTKAQRKEAKFYELCTTDWGSAWSRMITTQIRLIPQAPRSIAGKDVGAHPAEAPRAQIPAMTDASIDGNQEHHQKTLLKKATVRQAIGTLSERDALRIAATCRALGTVKRWVLL